MPRLNKLQQELFNRLSTGGDGKVLVQYLQEVCKECENARGKNTIEEVKAGVLASDLIKTHIIDKIQSYSQNQNVETNEDEYT